MNDLEALSFQRRLCALEKKTGHTDVIAHQALEAAGSARIEAIEEEMKDMKIRLRQLSDVLFSADEPAEDV